MHDPDPDDLPQWDVACQIVSAGLVRVRAASARAAVEKVRAALSVAPDPERHLTERFGRPEIQCDRRYVRQVPPAPEEPDARQP